MNLNFQLSAFDKAGSHIQPVDNPREHLEEWGFPAPEPEVAESLPPGGGGLVAPHYLSFSQIVNYVSRTYRHTHDEALKHSHQNALAARRDPVIMDALRARQLAVAQLPWHLEAVDADDPRQEEAVDVLTDTINEIPRFQQLRVHLLEALWFGRYATQLTYGWDFRKGRRRLVVKSHRPVNGDKLVYRYGGQVGLLVHPTFPGEWSVTERGRAHFLTPSEREQFLIHQHEPEDADFFEPELGGSVHGVGIRGRIYWMWWIRNQVMAWMMDFLERVGAGGFTIYYYEHGNPESAAEVKDTAEEQFRNNAILFPRYRDNKTGGPGIDRIEPSMAGAQLLQHLVTDYFDSVIRRYILGQELTSESSPTGLGSGLSDLHADTFVRIIKYDATNLEETLTQDLVHVLCRYSFPGVPCPRLKHDVDKPNAAEFLEGAKSFYEMGGTLDEDEIRSILGLAAPQPGNPILAQMSPLSPNTVGAAPTGVPMMGQPGPEGAGPPVDPAAAGLPPGPVQMSRKSRPRRYGRFEPHPRIANEAASYVTSAGLQQHPVGLDYVPVDEERAKAIADHYEKTPHAPNDPKVAGAYDAFKRETLAQFKHLQAQGVRFEPWLQEGQPYANSKEMASDVRDQKRIRFFVGGDFPDDHPLKEPTDIEIGGHRLTHNDAFRAVHDYFGHALYGNEFGPRGEEHAWRTHARMYSPQALPAMSFETRGQNSWVNSGSHLRDESGRVRQKGETGFLSPTERPFAEQKANTLPPELSDPT